jgi:hypothetical protein
MENTEMTWFAGLQQKYNLLHFLATASVLVVLWELLILISLFDGMLFRDPSELGMDMFMVFVFPLIVAPLISGLAIFIAKLLSIRGIRLLVVVGLGVVIPVVAFVLSLLGHLIARRLYAGHPIVP